MTASFLFGYASSCILLVPIACRIDDISQLVIGLHQYKVF
jgi:hypothetical protein